MDFDWTNAGFEPSSPFSTRQIEESFEDPFSLRLMPDTPRFSKQVRYFCLGRTLQGDYIFSVYWSNGKQIRVIASRPMTAEETNFYELKVRQSL